MSHPSDDFFKYIINSLPVIEGTYHFLVRIGELDGGEVYTNLGSSGLYVDFINDPVHIECDIGDHTFISETDHSVYLLDIDADDVTIETCAVSEELAFTTPKGVMKTRFPVIFRADVEPFFKYKIEKGKLYKREDKNWIETKMTETTKDPIAWLYQPRKVDGKLWYPPLGKIEKAKLILVASAPTKEDVEAGHLMAGAYGIEVQNAMEAAGINEDDVYITTMVKYAVKGKPTSTDIEACRQQLDFELRVGSPKLIMTLGAEPFKTVMKANMKVTDSLGEIIDSPYGKLLPNYSPGMIISQDPKERPFFRDVFELARKFIDDDLNYTPFEYVVISDPEENRKILQKYMAEGKWTIGYDAEWLTDKFPDAEKMYTFQYSCEPHKAVILNILPEENGNENLELLNTMKEYLEDPRAKRMGWNIRADDKRLTLRGFNLADETLGCDGMKLCGFIDSRWGKGLETGIKKFTKYESYYNDFFAELKKNKLKKEQMSKLKFINPDIFYKYCAGDAVAHYTACFNMLHHFESKFPKKQVEYYKKIYLPLSNYFMDLELTGIPIDKDVMTEITDKYTTKYKELENKIIELLKPFGFDSAKLALAEANGLPTDGIEEDFNPRSALQKRKLLFDVLKLTPAYYTKPPKPPKPRAWWLKQKPETQKQYGPSTNSKSLATIKFDLEKALDGVPVGSIETEHIELRQKHEIIKTLLELTRVGVFATKFLNKRGTKFAKEDKAKAVEVDTEIEGEAAAPDDEEDPLKQSYWAAICEDMRIHPDFYECLANFRSSSTPNVQNPASKVLSHIPEIFVPGYTHLSKEQKKEADKKIPRNIRHIFYSGDPDWYWAEVDVAGADLAIAAFLSGDEDYQLDILKGNFHLHKMREYFRNPNLSKDDASSYVTAKAITFRVAYTSELQSAAIPIQAEIYAESGILVSEEKISYALNTWNRYKTYMRFRDQCKKQVEDYNFIENARGIRYYFEETDNFGIKAGWLNESLAYPIASELAMFLWDVSVSIKNHMKKDGTWMKYAKPVNSVHDAGYWLIHKDLMKDGYFPEVCKHFFTRECKLATGDNLGMEMVVADRWKGKEKIFAKETAWNFEKKIWEWKEDH